MTESAETLVSSGSFFFELREGRLTLYEVQESRGSLREKAFGVHRGPEHGGLREALRL